MTQHKAGPTGGRLSDLVRDVLEESPEAARAYLRESWLSAAIRALREARRKANLTQAEVAERMGTTQPAVARLENDLEGRTTLHRYIDYALACGALPLNIVLEPFESVRQFAIDQPEAVRTQVCYQAWAEQQSIANVQNVAASVGQPMVERSVDPQVVNTLLVAFSQGLLWHSAAVPLSPSASPSSFSVQSVAPTAPVACPPGTLKNDSQASYEGLTGQNVPPNSPALAA
ncbi:MAG TPA: helix-turn-helix domain-containing protein [Chloroflexota bacterium]|nr:helix-turn-helix domain-containing protein [Chloroflexota bacterium]